MDPRLYCYISSCCYNSMLFLLGVLIDLRSAMGEDECVSVKEAKKIALECNLVQYLEVSSLLKEGLDHLFEVAVSYLMHLTRLWI